MMKRVYKSTDTRLYIRNGLIKIALTAVSSALYQRPSD